MPAKATWRAPHSHHQQAPEIFTSGVCLKSGVRPSTFAPRFARWDDVWPRSDQNAEAKYLELDLIHLGRGRYRTCATAFASGARVDPCDPSLDDQLGAPCGSVNLHTPREFHIHCPVVVIADAVVVLQATLEDS
jgi:hypothetical protein